MSKIFRRTALLAGLAAVLMATNPAFADGNVEEGKKVFRKCAVCHDTAPGKTKIGPSLAGVFGRKSAQAPGYSFSPAMKKANVVWNEEALEKYLEAPSKMVPGTRMAFAGLRSDKERDHVIAYLKTLK